MTRFRGTSQHHSLDTTKRGRNVSSGKRQFRDWTPERYRTVPRERDMQQNSSGGLGQRARNIVRVKWPGHLGERCGTQNNNFASLSCVRKAFIIPRYVRSNQIQGAPFPKISLRGQISTPSLARAPEPLQRKTRNVQITGRPCQKILYVN